MIKMISKFLKKLLMTGSRDPIRSKLKDIDVQIAEINLRLNYLETLVQTQSSLISDVANIQNNIVVHLASRPSDAVSSVKGDVFSLNDDDDLIN